MKNKTMKTQTVKNEPIERAVTREAVRTLNIVILSAVLYRTDLRSAIAFISLLVIEFWAIPAIATLIVDNWKE